MSQLDRLKLLIEHRKEELNERISGKSVIYTGVGLERLIAQREELTHVQMLISKLEQS